jgi:hypothetical protein
MALARKTTFATHDAAQLKVELEREHADIVQTFGEVLQVSARKWRAPYVLPDGATITAEKNQMVIARGGIVRPPGNAEPGDVFRVVHITTGATVSIVSDQAIPVQGSILGEGFFGLSGWVEYMFCGAEIGWWRQLR